MNEDLICKCGHSFDKHSYFIPGCFVRGCGCEHGVREERK